MNKYCAFTGGDPVAFLWRMWINNGLNPDFKLTVHNDTEVEEFMKSFSPAAYKYYMRIPNGSIRSDFWRVVYLLKHGGVYLDADLEPLASLRTYVYPTDTFVSSGSLYVAQVNFHIIVARPQERVLQMTFANLMKQYKSTKYSYWSWSGCKQLHTALRELRDNNRPSECTSTAHCATANHSSRVDHSSKTGSGLELGEGFHTATGEHYRLLLERRVSNWPGGSRKATCLRTTSAGASLPSTSPPTSNEATNNKVTNKATSPNLGEERPLRITHVAGGQVEGLQRDGLGVRVVEGREDRLARHRAALARVPTATRPAAHAAQEARRGGSALRAVMLNKYMALPGTSVANSTRAAHWGFSVDLWAPHSAQRWLWLSANKDENLPPEGRPRTLTGHAGVAHATRA